MTVYTAVKHTACMFKLHWNRGSRSGKKGPQSQSTKTISQFSVPIGQNTHTLSEGFGHL